MGHHTTTTSQTFTASRWQGTSAAVGPLGVERDPLAPSHWCTLVRYTGSISAISNMPSPIPRMGAIRCHPVCPGGPRSRPRDPRQVQACRVLHRRDLCGGEKGGSGVGKTKRGKGTKLMAVADSSSLPVAIHATSASPHEVTLVEDTLAQRHTRTTPKTIIGDLAYDSDGLDRRLAQRRITLIAPHRCNRIRPATQDGRSLRRYRRRWKIERLFAWLHNYRRVSTRHDYYLANYLGFAQLACILILLKNGF